MKVLQALGITVAAFAVIVVGFIAAYPLLYPTYSHRYRLTLEVETPDGLKTGSSVIEPSARAQPPILVNTPSVTGLKGDAVFVDLGKVGSLLGLLAVGKEIQAPYGPVYLAIKAFGVPNCKEPFCQWREIAHISGARDLPPDLLPALVTLSSNGDPKSARFLQPGELETVLGPGYRLKRAWIELTQEPVTHEISATLPWVHDRGALKTFAGALLDSGFRPGGSFDAGTLIQRGD
jgi:hypothetical protein